ncbi:recombinase family protein [Carnobacteriaceae bacterium zg-ZUI252]|nr:recombinase family protein [Carnobacteriaceae bacterium zg-ZUI252]
MKQVNVIFSKTDAVNRKKRVAVYARVSSNSKEQQYSLEAQKQHYEHYVKAQLDWELVGIYFDEGISGTSLKHRTGLNCLVEDCEKGLVDLIMTKSISRFARNTIDCLALVRRLLVYDVAVRFEKENIQTDSMDDEVMLSILAELAANESKTISDNEKWAIQKRFQDGTYVISYPPYGYRNEGGNMVVVSEEAKIVQDIFNWTLKGESTPSVAKRLNEQGVLTKRNNKWSPTSVIGIIKNEKYVGDVLFQKYYTDDQFVKHKNYGDKDMYYIENHHEAIVDREVFQKANEVLKQRGLEKGVVADRHKYQKRYALSGKVKCTECGSTFKRRMHTTTQGKCFAWCCSKHIADKASCSMKYVEEEAIQIAFITMMNKLLFSKEFILKPLQKHIQYDNDSSNGMKLKVLQSELEDVQMKLKEAQSLFQREYLNYISYQNLELDLMQENDRIVKKINYLKMMDSQKVSIQQHLDILLQRLNCSQYWTEYDENLVAEVIEQINIISRQCVQFVLKCGLTIEERLI